LKVEGGQNEKKNEQKKRKRFAIRKNVFSLLVFTFELTTHVTFSVKLQYNNWLGI
jgi:hypothetical protein